MSVTKATANAEAVYFLRDAPASARKQFPIATGVLDYFPDALALVALVSKRGNDQHNPGQPMHWARGKSNDQPDTIVRHIMDRGTVDSDQVFHTAKSAWRNLALLQTEVEEFVAEHGVEELLYVLGVVERPPASPDTAASCETCGATGRLYDVLEGGRWRTVCSQHIPGKL